MSTRRAQFRQTASMRHGQAQRDTSAQWAEHHGGIDEFRLLTLDEFVSRPQLAYHVRRLIPAGAVVLVFGAPKSGKTFAVCDLAMHAAHGLDWHGCKISRQLRVVFLAGEGINGLRIRLRAWQRAYEHTAKPTFRLLPEPLSLCEQTSKVIATLREFKPDLIVIDTLNAFFGAGDENSTQDMSRFTLAVRQLRDEFGCSVLVIHHTGIADAGRERGSSVLRGAADVIVQVARDKLKSDLVGFQVIQARDLEPWDEPIGFQLKVVETDWTDDDGAALSTCVIQAASQPVTIPGRGSKRLSNRQQQLANIVQQIAATTANGSADVVLTKADITRVARELGIPKQSICSALKSLVDRGYWQSVSNDSISVRLHNDAHNPRCR